MLPTENQLYFRCEKHPPFPYKQSKYSTNILAESIRHTLMVISPPLEREEPWLSPPPPRLNAARDVHCSGSRRRRPITYTECVKGQVCFLCNIDSEVCACSTFTVSTNPKGGQISKKNICISLLGKLGILTPSFPSISLSEYAPFTHEFLGMKGGGKKIRVIHQSIFTKGRNNLCARSLPLLLWRKRGENPFPRSLLHQRVKGSFSKTGLPPQKNVLSVWRNPSQKSF